MDTGGRQLKVQQQASSSMELGMPGGLAGDAAAATLPVMAWRNSVLRSMAVRQA